MRCGDVYLAYDNDICGYDQSQHQRSTENHPSLGQLLQNNPPRTRAHGPPHPYLGAPHPQSQPAVGSCGNEHIDHQEHPEGLPFECSGNNVQAHQLLHRSHRGDAPVAVGHLTAPGPRGPVDESAGIHVRTEAEDVARGAVPEIQDTGLGSQHRRHGIIHKAELQGLDNSGYHPVPFFGRRAGGGVREPAAHRILPREKGHSQIFGYHSRAGDILYRGIFGPYLAVVQNLHVAGSCPAGVDTVVNVVLCGRVDREEIIDVLAFQSGKRGTGLRPCAHLGHLVQCLPEAFQSHFRGIPHVRFRHVTVLPVVQGLEFHHVHVLVIIAVRCSVSAVVHCPYLID